MTDPHNSASPDQPPGCAACKFRAYAERKPNSWLARLWRWHTRWCPGWKSYQRWLTEHGETDESVRNRM